ncbi:MAG: hypothetical protein Q7R41_06805, partial [Phycisphaerales bacterium]|nr:hypothetical protein [Phycisphaerales bacterium]
FADQKLKRVDIGGGNVQTIADAASGFGATWNADGMILFAGENTAPLLRVPATAGERPVEATRLEKGQVSHRFPQLLPDGHRFLFFATGPADVQGVYLGSLDTTETRRIVDSDTRAEFLPPHWLLFGREDGLYAQHVDPETFVTSGDAVFVAGRVARSPQAFASLAVSASTSGVLAYRTDAESTRELVWVDRQGRQIGTFGAPPGLTARPGWLSPDGRTVAVGRTVDGNEDIWLIDTARGVLRRLTFDAATDFAAAWSPDGSRIVFSSSRKAGGRYDIYQRSLGGSDDELLLETAENKNASDWSPDDRFILYANRKTNDDIWALPLDGDRKPFVVVHTPFNEANAHFSPDGRWISYASNETGRSEVFVTRFPGGGRNWQISTNGGDNSRWRDDGRELIYLAPDDRIMAVPVSLDANAPSVEAGNPVALFAVRPGSRVSATPDAQRFLINTPTNDAAASPITIVLNWKPPNQ